MTTKNKKDILRERAELKSQMKALDASISVKEDAGEDASAEETKFSALKSRLNKIEAKLERMDAVGEDDCKDEDSADAGEEDKDEDESDSSDAEKNYRAPVAKRLYINRNTALAPMVKGEFLGRLAVAQFHKALGGLEAGQRVVMNTWGDTVVKDALTTSQPIIPQDYQTGLIPLLQAESVIRKIARTIAMPMGQMTLFRQNLGSTGAYIGEGAAIGATQAGFDRINMTWHKYGALTYATKEMLEFSPVDAASAMTNDLVSRLALLEDQTFLLGTGTSSGVPSPVGILNQVNQTTNVLSSTLNASSKVDFQTISFDLENMETQLRANLVKGPYAIIMPERTIGFLKQASSIYGVFPFKEELSKPQPTLNGHPVYTTTLLPSNVADAASNTSISYILMVKSDHLIIGDAYRYGLQMTDSASFVDGGTQVNTFGQDLVAYKVTNAHDFAMEHDVSAVVLKADGWSLGNEGSKWSYNAPAGGTSGSSASGAKSSS